MSDGEAAPCARTFMLNMIPLAKQMQPATATRSRDAVSRSSHLTPGTKNALIIASESASTLRKNENILPTSRSMAAPDAAKVAHFRPMRNPR